ncbi:hypothetical protein [Mycolicibacterium baixiangningiae]|uniref:hypothetical protein n=1 Tax=Mycolicibacterium baixiangningiae TaxID=2761578 RepID=UPI0018D17863|nr:hypothetical protein [Mycolicibacterium baixiangningiae]
MTDTTFSHDTDLPPVTVAILVCPGYMPVDIIGIHTVFGTAPGATVHLVWKDLDEITGFPTFPTRATSNFQQKHLLERFGAIPADGNVVIDRNRITAGPLTGSVEAALLLAQRFYGDDAAREMELQAEYAPQPIFGVGRPDLAGPELTQRALDHSAAIVRPYVEAIDRAAKRLGAVSV